MGRGFRAAAAFIVAGILVTSGCAGKGRRPNPPATSHGSEVRARPLDQAGEGAPEAAAAPELPGALTVMIDNHPDAWPQAGVDQADVVYEAVAEGGITRFLAVFYTRAPAKIGPVRSARPYFVEIARAYAAPYAHAGGSEDAYASLRRLAVWDLDEIRNAGPYFWRSRDRRAPHNLYTSARRLLEVAGKRGWSLTPPPALPGGEVSGGAAAELVSITYSDNRWYRYTAAYRFSGGRYEKLVNGTPLTAEGGRPVTAANVIVLFTDIVPTGDKDGHMEVAVVGEGDALFFTGGRAYEGRWRKAAPDAHFEFTREGVPMVFAAGPTWVNIVGDRGQVSYSPGAASAPAPSAAQR